MLAVELSKLNELLVVDSSFDDERMTFYCSLDSLRHETIEELVQEEHLQKELLLIEECSLLCSTDVLLTLPHTDIGTFFACLSYV